MCASLQSKRNPTNEFEKVRHFTGCRRRFLMNKFYAFTLISMKFDQNLDRGESCVFATYRKTTSQCRQYDVMHDVTIDGKYPFRKLDAYFIVISALFQGQDCRFLICGARRLNLDVIKPCRTSRIGIRSP